MPTAERSKTFDFTDGSIWTTSGDASIANDALTVTAPELSLPWATHWDNEPGYDGNGDAVLADGVTYKGYTGGADIEFEDGTLEFQVKAGLLAGGKFFRIKTRLLTANDISLRVDATGLHNDDAGLDAEYGKLLDETMRKWLVRIKDATQLFDVPGLNANLNREVGDPDDTGAFSLDQNDSANPITLGGGIGGTAAEPILYRRRQGACDLKAASGWLIPKGVSSLTRMVAIAEPDYRGSDSDPEDVTSVYVALQYKLVGDANWTDVPSDGDMSAVTYTAGTSILLIRVNDGNGAGLDSGDDPRYAPKVHGVVLTYEVSVPQYATDDEIREVLTNVLALLNADETLAAYDGWSGAKLHWPGLMALKPTRKCGVMVAWNRSPEKTALRGQTGGVEQNVKYYDHDIDVVPWWRADKDLGASVLSDSGLFTLSQAVRNALRRATLGDTVHITGIDDSEPLPIAYGLEPQDVLPGVRIGIVVQSKLFEGT